MSNCRSALLASTLLFACGGEVAPTSVTTEQDDAGDGGDLLLDKYGCADDSLVVDSVNVFSGSDGGVAITSSDYTWGPSPALCGATRVQWLAAHPGAYIDLNSGTTQPIPGGHKLITLTAQLRGDDVGAAIVMLSTFNGANRTTFTSTESTPQMLTGSFDWTNVTIQVDAQGGSTFWIAVALRDRGTLDVADVSVSAH